MKTNTLKSFRITLDVIDNKTTRVVKIEQIAQKKKTLSARQLYFKKDDTKQLLSKMNDERFVNYRTEILDLLKNRYSTALHKPTERNKKNLELIGLYYQDLFGKMMKETDIKKVA